MKTVERWAGAGSAVDSLHSRLVFSSVASSESGCSTIALTLRNRMLGALFGATECFIVL